jgi:FKBP-type peptidyl-prolyl cis-trans isomerase SlyD
MNIEDKVYVAIDYRLSLPGGEEVDKSVEPFGFVTGAGQIIPGLEKELMGKSEGYEAQVVVGPEDAYGPVNENLVQEIPRSQFPEDTEIEPGMTFHAQGPQGPIMLTVKTVNDNETVTVDLNHPLAGKELHFDVKVVEVREPTAQELALAEQQVAGCGCGCDTTDQSGCGTGGCAC